MRHHPLLRQPIPRLFTLAVCAWLAAATQVAAEPASTGSRSLAPEAAAQEEFNLDTLKRLRARLDDSDRIAALRALQMALSRISDGATFVWRKKSRQLAGVIKPTMAFRNAQGQICRHLIYSLSLGRYVKSIEGVACREADGRWRLAG